MRWVCRDVPLGHPDRGAVFPCPTCAAPELVQARAIAQRARLEALDGLTPKLRSYRFERTAKPALRYLGAALKELERRTRLDPPQGWISLTGTHGPGKTWALCCAVNAGRERGLVSLYWTSARLLEYIRRTFNPDAPVTTSELWDTLATAPILALDEFDRVNPTPWAEERLIELVGERERRDDHTLTIFATNSRIQDLPPYFKSRLLGNPVYEIIGPDLRQSGL